MKIGIITLVSDNYGNKYQNYAVETLLSQYGNVETFAVANEYFENKKGSMAKGVAKFSFRYIKEVLKSRMLYQYDMTNISRGVLLNLVYVLLHKKSIVHAKEKRRKAFEQYTKNNLHISDRVIASDNCVDEEWKNTFDFFFCGSDQIWNPTYATTTKLAFLSFANPGQAIAIAPSFGVANIPEKRKAEFAKWISGIDKLSVREKTGQDIIKELTGRDAEVLLDPTMAIDAKEWINMTKKPAAMPGRYILCYFLGCVDKNCQKKIKAYSKKMGLPVVSLFNVEEPDYYVLDPNEVLYAIQKAEIVITDSFHGSIFSILFHKDFVVFDRNEGGASMSSRLSTLLQKFELKERKNMLIDSFNCIEESKWNKVDKILLIEKNKTKSYIEEAIGVK